MRRGAATKGIAVLVYMRLSEICITDNSGAFRSTTDGGDEMAFKTSRSRVILILQPMIKYLEMLG